MQRNQGLSEVPELCPSFQEPDMRASPRVVQALRHPWVRHAMPAGLETLNQSLLDPEAAAAGAGDLAGPGA